MQDSTVPRTGRREAGLPWRCALRVVDALTMKPVAPRIPQADAAEGDSSIHSEVLRLCDAQDQGDRITLPAPPSSEMLRAATPFPPPLRAESTLDTIPSPPPSAARKRGEAGTDEAAPSTIPGPPRLPRIAEV